MNDGISCPYCDHEQLSEDITAEYGGNFEYQDGCCLSINCETCNQNFNVRVFMDVRFEVEE